jgi:hypothetical protein
MFNIPRKLIERVQKSEINNEPDEDVVTAQIEV